MNGLRRSSMAVYFLPFWLLPVDPAGVTKLIEKPCQERAFLSYIGSLPPTRSLGIEVFEPQLADARKHFSWFRPWGLARLGDSTGTSAPAWSTCLVLLDFALHRLFWMGR